MSQADDNKFKITVPLLLQLGVMLVSVMLAYGALNERISRLEERYENVLSKLTEINADVKTLLRRQ